MENDLARKFDKLADLFKTLITISVAGIGFMFAVNNRAGYEASFPDKLAIASFALTVLASLFGYVAITARSLGNMPKSDFWLSRPTSWFGIAWLTFASAIAACTLLAFPT